jgi:hypothetical protein
MSSIALRRLALTCRPTSSIYRNQRTFTTSLPLFNETNSGSSVDSPRTVTLIPGKHIRLLISHNHCFPFKVMVLVQKFQIVFKKYLMRLMYQSIGNRLM